LQFSPRGKFWVLAPCCLAEVYHHFRDAHYHHEQDKLITLMMQAGNIALLAIALVYNFHGLHIVTYVLLITRLCIDMSPENNRLRLQFLHLGLSQNDKHSLQWHVKWNRMV
jgi:hypothetical protein